MFLRAGFLGLALAFTTHAYAEEPNAECKILTFENISCVGPDLLAHFISCQKTTKMRIQIEHNMLVTDTRTAQKVITFSRNLSEINEMISTTTGKNMFIATSSLNDNIALKEMVPALRKTQDYLESQPNACEQKVLKLN